MSRFWRWVALSSVLTHDCMSSQDPGSSLFIFTLGPTLQEANFSNNLWSQFLAENIANLLQKVGIFMVNINFSHLSIWKDVCKNFGLGILVSMFWSCMCAKLQINIPINPKRQTEAAGKSAEFIQSNGLLLFHAPLPPTPPPTPKPKYVRVYLI